MSSKGVHSIKAKSFTPEEIQELREAFNTIDTDGSGELDLDEVKNFMKQADLPLELSDLVYFLFDGDEKHGITFDGFTNFFQLLNKIDEDPLYAFRALFDKIDKDKSGEIDREELKKFMSILGFDIADDEVDAVIQLVDSDNSGAISFEEIVKALELI